MNWQIGTDKTNCCQGGSNL